VCKIIASKYVQNGGSKNKKEAKDPRWSNALSVDVTPQTPTKNAKALRLV
jgi:hypothetical protein